MKLSTNPQLELALEFVRDTNKHIFLTGKAGTGKTTFLRQLQNESIKRMVIVASTGVAAINAGGMTIHSFFQLPFGPIVPGQTNDPSRQRQFTREKIRVIQGLDLLVIDEISMVRADLLDGIDEVLRRYKDRFKPFGGAQLLMIGDLHQLPPVVKDEEWNLLREHYNTAYFFGSHALQKMPPVTIELKHIYRQADATFIELLNKVRDNKLDQKVFDQLNSRYIPDFKPADDEAYITLTAHNAAAQAINAEKLSEIKGNTLRFTAEVDGDFPAFSYPTDLVLECKVNAQVMFVKNDPTSEKRYYNGRIGRVTRISDEVIYVNCPGDTFDIAVSPDEWRNIKYSLDEQSKEVKEDIQGTFKQYPLKLAWAITIHKSQGLTFERAIIDAQAAFAHGQVYVALSRCKSFEGIVLRSKIGPSSVRTDTVVKNYSEENDRNTPDEAHLQTAKIEYQQSLLRELFDSKTARRLLDLTVRHFLAHEKSLPLGALELMQSLQQTMLEEWIVLADKFLPQLELYFKTANQPAENEALLTRVQKASTYFSEKISQQFLPALFKLPVNTDNKAIAKVIDDALQNLHRELFVKNACYAASQTSFSPQQYLTVKANAAIDFEALSAKPDKKSKTAAQAEHTAHPVLYQKLFDWREELASQYEVEPYLILQRKPLMDIIAVLPNSLPALKKIKGIGGIKIKKFGKTIVDIVSQYMADKQITNAGIEFPEELLPSTKSVKPDTKSISYGMFKEGKTIEEIALERSLVASTIEGHLSYYVEQGKLDVFQVVEEKKVNWIMQCILDHPDALFAEIKSALGDDYTYGEIRLVQAHFKVQEEVGEELKVEKERME
jgi:tRNA uridine 5-carbamoylmethylation protein Kti12